MPAPQSLIWSGFVTAYFGMMGGMIALTMDIANYQRVLVVFGAILLVGAGIIALGKIRERGGGRR